MAIDIRRRSERECARAMIHHDEDPFATPVELRDVARQFRGRLASPVTAWTTTDDDGAAAGITVSSLVVTEGDPATVIGLIDPLSLFWTALAEARRFVVHILEGDDRRLADQLAGRYPGPDARFENVRLGTSEWGPVLLDVTTRAYCTLADVNETGDSLVVSGTIDKIELTDITDPLVYFRGAYHLTRPRNPPA